MKSILVLLALAVSLYACRAVHRHKRPDLYASLSQPDLDGENDSIYRGFSSGLEELMWKDSTYVTFLTISYYEQISITNAIKVVRSPDHMIYRTFFGPVSVWFPIPDSCNINSLFTANQTGYFLLDDFIRLKDSLPVVTIRGGTGYVDMNYMAGFMEFGNISKKDLTPDLDSLQQIPGKVYATKKWYKQWIKDHPGYKDQRTNEYNNGSCE